MENKSANKSYLEENKKPSDLFQETIAHQHFLCRRLARTASGPVAQPSFWSLDLGAGLTRPNTGVAADTCAFNRHRTQSYPNLTADAFVCLFVFSSSLLPHHQVAVEPRSAAVYQLREPSSAHIPTPATTPPERRLCLVHHRTIRSDRTYTAPDARTGRTSFTQHRPLTTAIVSLTIPAAHPHRYPTS